MKPAIRTQKDAVGKKGDALSLATGTDFTGTEDMARQEFAAEVNINNILTKHGVPLSTRQPTFGAFNYDMDLHQATATIREAQAAFTRLPKELREKYRNWAGVLEAVERGELNTINPKPDEKAQPSGPTGSAPSTGTPPGENKPQS